MSRFEDWSDWCWNLILACIYFTPAMLGMLAICGLAWLGVRRKCSKARRAREAEIKRRREM